jgi:hypothetical protein
VLTQDGIHLVSLRAAGAASALQPERQLFAAEEAPVAFEFRTRLAQQTARRLTPSPADATRRLRPLGR